MKGKGKSATKGKKLDAKFAWKKVLPKDKDPKKTIDGHTYHHKQFDGKTYYWCIHHMAWCLHLPEGDGPTGCHLCQQQERSDKDNEQNKQVMFKHPLSMIINEIEDKE
jgi:hypothetical protein